MPSEPSKSSPAAAVSSFASLLAGLTTLKRPASDPLSDDLLADDFATISYEQALRTHARYRPADPPPLPTVKPDPSAPKPPQSVRISEWVPESDLPPSLAANRRSASITIRLSQSEYAQLRKRAADAGLTLSAYLRSCIFEVETLRAEVKDALMHLTCRPNAGSALPSTEAPKHPEPPSRGWRERLFPGLRRADA